MNGVVEQLQLEENELTHKTQISETSKNHTDDDDTRKSPTASSFTIKPAVNKNTHSRDPSKPSAKRALNDAEGRKDLLKKSKVDNDDLTKEDKEGTQNSGSGSGWIWNPVDEIAILGGMIDYQKQKGADAHKNMDAFLEFIKESFLIHVTMTQLYEKFRMLNMKFVANLRKGEKFIPCKPYERECFELSKKLWGDDNVTASVENIDGDPNDKVVGNGVGHTESAKIVDGVCGKKKNAKGKSSKGKRKEKGEKKKKERDKNNNKKMKKIDDGPKISEEETGPITNEDVMKDKEYVSREEETGPVTNEDVMKDKECGFMEEKTGPVTNEDVMKDMEYVLKDDENVVRDSEQNIPLNYPNLIASLSMDMPESHRKLVMEGIGLVDSEKARELDVNWKALRMEEIEFYCRKLELMAEQSRLVMDALKKKR